MNTQHRTDVVSTSPIDTVEATSMQWKSYLCLTPTSAASFAEAWLPAWTGDDPERLVEFYAEDAIYADPLVPSGIRGRAALLAHFTRLLRANPDWVWTQRRSVPMSGGFLNHWHAVIPTPSGEPVEIDGVCTVAFHDGRIIRNEVFFDTSSLTRAR